jgi:hypothetical protein
LEHLTAEEEVTKYDNEIIIILMITIEESEIILSKKKIM